MKKRRWIEPVVTVALVITVSVVLSFLAFSFVQSVKLSLLEERWSNLTSEVDAWCNVANYKEMLEHDHEDENLFNVIDLMIPYFVMIRSREHAYAGVYSPEFQLLSEHQYSLSSLGFSVWDYPEIIKAVRAHRSGTVNIDVSFLLDGKSGRFFHIYFKNVTVPATGEAFLVMAGFPFDFSIIGLPQRVYNLIYLSYGVFCLVAVFVIYFTVRFMANLIGGKK